MNRENNISLRLSEDTINAQCEFAIAQARNTSHALAMLIALQSFVSATVQPSDKHSPAFEAIKRIIENHAANLRAAMLSEQAAALRKAMQQHDCAAVMRIHAGMSRNGFWQASQQAIPQMDSAELTSAGEWAENWCADAKSRALAASGYPDALNFGKAGISPHEYAAMTELRNYLMDIREL